MRLSIPFIRKKKDSPAYFLALLLSSEKTGVVILEESKEKIKIIGRQDQLFKNSIEEIPLEELIDTIDHVISRALEALPPDIEIRKTVFGVKESWVEKESKKIKKDYLQKLKKVCDSLDLTPIGFIVVNEAISNLIQKEEGVPVSAIFAEIGKKIVTLTLFRGGASVQSTEGPVTENYPSTVDALLKHFLVEVLPARIILYDSGINTELLQQFIKHQWSKSLPFLHMPQISVLPPDFDGRAMTYGTASQMGLDSLDNETQNSIKTYEPSAHVQKEEKESTDEPAENTSQHKHHLSDHENVIKKDNFGFAADKDIAEEHREITQDKSFDDIEETDSLSDKNADEEIEEDYKEHENKIKLNKMKLSEKFKLPRIGIPSKPYLWLMAIILPIIIIGATAGGVYYLYFNKVKASIIVTLTPKNVTQSTEVVFTAEATNDYPNNVIAAKQIDGTLDGDMTTAATGKKDVGDKAHGEVTVYNNNTDSDVTLSTGATIKSSNGLNFTLDKEVKVASASGDIFSGTKPGTANVNVTAGDIGTNYNLPSDTKFTVEGNNSLAAKNDSAFSGGSKKTVTVVSKDDLAKLKTDLLKNLESKAREELAKQTQSDGIILPIILSSSIEKSKYDKNTGDESKTVKLSATINFTGLSYQITDEKNFAKAILADKYANEMTFDDNRIDIAIKDPKKESEREIAGTLTFNASLLPKIETKELAKKLSGKPTKDMNSIISGLPQVRSTTVTYQPNIPILANIFPRLPNNVTVTLSSN